MANGLLVAIINPAQADVIGAFDKGRERQATAKAGQILGETFTGKIGALARLDPDKAIALSKAVGIPLDDAGRLNNFMGTAVAANKLVQAGLTQEATQFVSEAADKIEALAGPGQASRMRDMATRLQSGDPQAFEQLSQLAQAFDPTKPVTLAKDATLVDPVTGRTIAAGIKTPEELPGDIDFKAFRTLNNDVTALIAEPLKIRRAAERLEKIGETKSPTDQLAAIFTFMKALDPTSVVREGEQQAARSTGGPADQFVGLINQIKGEGALPVAVFNNMIATAKRLSDEASKGSRLELTSSLDAFGSRLRDEDKLRLLDRVPGIFDVAESPLSLLPQGSIDNNDGTFTLPTGEVVEPE